MLPQFSLPRKTAPRRDRSSGNTWQYEHLEPRRLLAISFNPASGDLTLYGTNSADSGTVSMLDAATVRAELNESTQDFSLSAVQQILFYGYGGGDSFHNQTNIQSSAFGGDGDDVLTGGGAADLISGGSGNDTLDGGGGSDIVSGNAGDDDVRGGSADDDVFGGGGADRLFGDGGDDYLLGGAGNDIINGGGNVDILSGNSGLDILRGGGGNDTIYGGDDADQLFGDDGGDNIFGLNGNDELFGGNGNDRLVGGNDDDILEGGNDDDTVSGNAGNDTLRGDGGNDDVFGGDGDDDLFGGDGNDYLVGGLGDDTAEGGDGADILSGNAGIDLLRGGIGNDRIYGGPGDDVLYGDNGADVILGISGQDEIHGGFGNDQLDGGADNDLIYGDSGSDNLFGRGGNDGLFGGIGGGDVLQGNEGSDRFMIWAGDVMLDRGLSEAQLEFRNETSNWTEAEIKVIDQGLHQLQERAGTSLVIRDSLDTDPVLYTKWANLDGAAGVNFLRTMWNSQTGYTYDREIRFAEWNENNSFTNNQMISVTIHEVAHSWDTTEEIGNVFSGSAFLWDNFLAVSSWTQSNPNSSDYTQSLDGQWWYLDSAPFYSNYGRTNPYEDWSTIWQAAFDSLSPTDADRLGEKLAIFDQLMAEFQNA